MDFAISLLYSTFTTCFRSTSASLVQLDQSIEEASRGLGANWWYTFRRIVVPLTFTGILAGTLLALVQSFGEFVASILIYSTSTIPLSVAIFQNYMHLNLGPPVLMVSYKFV